LGNILHIETSAAYCSVSVAKDGISISAITGSVVNDHISQLTTIIDEVVNQSGLMLQNLDAIAVSAGPGSYTGLRIGVSTAKGLCHALNLPLIAVNSLESMVYGINSNYPENTLFCPVIDARRMEVYTILADKTGNVIIPQQAYIMEPEHLFLQELENRQIVFFGSGLNKCKSLLEHPNSIFHDDYIQEAVNMHFLANRQFEAGNFVEMAYFEPLYIKEFYTTLKIK
jgi:tRNA threonylcarbamoyladenosine biosynthesis protein TsaB